MASSASWAGRVCSVPGTSTGTNCPLSLRSHFTSTVTSSFRRPSASPTNFFTVVRYTRGSAPNFAEASSWP